MYLTSKNLFVVVYCCIFAPLKRILLRGESPQTIISSLLKRGESPQTTISSKKNRPYGFVLASPLLAQACSLCQKKTSVRLAPSDNYF